jgi:hypothetical protein
MSRAKNEAVEQTVQVSEPAEPWKSPVDLLTPAEEKPVYQNVKAEFNRAYVAGLCLKRYGLDHGVTDEMVYWLLSGAGEESEIACRRTMIQAWHIARGFVGVIPSVVPQDWIDAADGIHTEAQWWASTEEEVKEMLENKVTREAAEEVEELEQQLTEAKARLTAATAGVK